MGGDDGLNPVTTAQLEALQTLPVSLLSSAQPPAASHKFQLSFIVLVLLNQPGEFRVPRSKPLNDDEVGCVHRPRSVRSLGVGPEQQQGHSNNMPTTQF